MAIVCLDAFCATDYQAMNSMLRLLPLMIFTIGLVLEMSPAQVRAEALPKWVEPQDSYQAQHSPDEYAWRLFVALNWPADNSTRQADPSKVFGEAGPVVWEVWKNANEVFLQDGIDPGSWSSNNNQDDAAPMERFNAFTPLQQINARHIVNGVMVPMTDSANDPQQLREMHMNQVTFEYIRANELYSLDGQLTRYGQKNPIAFPLGAKEIKAEWQPIDSKSRSKYHTLELRTANGGTRLYGLTALHVLSKDLPNWFWATFEHVDNPSRTAAEPWLRNSVDRFACGNQRPNCNRVPRGLGLEHTAWQYYRLRGTQNDFVDSRGKPTLLANSQLESGTKQRASCITCHARASIGVFQGKITRLDPFDVTDSSPATTGVKRTYIGKPKEQWFYKVTELGVKQQVLMPLDFVWSLSKAQPKLKPRIQRSE
jgi:hypothetical protein